MFFAPENVHGQSLGKLVKKPLQNYARLLGKDGYLTTHLYAPYHQASVDAMNQWKKRMAVGAGDVDLQINRKAESELNSNRAILFRLLQALEYHGRLGLPLRGHRDSGEMPNSGDLNNGPQCSLDFGQGIFRSTLQLMIASGDEVKKNILRLQPKMPLTFHPLCKISFLILSDCICSKPSLKNSTEQNFSLF